ncbi:MAG TPA: carboxypeptidase regulatory-like domain-containing protein [Candidatus Acidoferrum sp.]|nr:carboxypeptidase regulatory-like domain-containing protein [Candidatus Acidoferrum sp.]
MKMTPWGRVILCVCACVIASGTSWGQTTGEIRGTAKDSSGAVVPGATVTAIMNGTAATRAVSADSNGAFDIPELTVGSYTVTGEAKGFKKFIATDVMVSIGHVTVVDISLQVGGSTDTVTVEANAVQVETTSTQLGAVMTDTAVRELPLSTRNTYQLLQLQPGVQSQLGADLFYGSSNAGVVSVNGGRGRSNNYMVNGGDGNDIFVNAPAIQPSPDAIEEFRVLTNTFDAEYGRNSGSVVNVVTKSGTNHVHGDVYEFLRNNVLNTRGYFDDSVADYKQNQFGATLGGPIKKDKTFVFGSYEGNRLVQGLSSGQVLLPTAQEASGDFSAGSPFQGGVVDQNFADILNARNGGACQTAIGAPVTVGQNYSDIFPGNIIPTACFDPTALALYNKYVAPFGTGTITELPNQTEREDQFTVRFDHSLSPAQKLSVYYYFNDDNQTQPFATFQGAGSNLPGFGSLFATRVQQWNVSHTWTIGASMVNEFRFNYFREGQRNLDHPLNTLTSIQDACGTAVPATNCFADPSDPGGGITTNLPGHMGVPFINVNGGFVIGNNYEGELPQVGNTFQWTDNLTKIFGGHTVKFGGDVRRQRFDQFLYFEVNGNYAITNANNADQIGSDDAYPNYFLGAVNVYQQGSAQAEDLRNTALYLFAQDSYKLKPNLTLNYGLRWELNTPYYDLGNRMQTFRPGQPTTQYPCWLSQENASALGLSPGDCGQGSSANNAVFPLGLVFPGDKGVPRGLTSTVYNAFAPRVGVAWSPGWTEGWLAKLTGGPGNSSIRAGFGIFYNPIEQLVLEQFSAEPPFGGSTFLSNTLFNLPFQFQAGGDAPNPFSGVINQTPQTPCAVDTPGGPNGCVDWSNFRPLLLFGEFQPHLKSQYSEQYNLTIERQLTNNMLVRVGYVGTESHHLLASHDLNYGNTQTCAVIAQIAANDPSGNSVLTGPGGDPGNTCAPFGGDSEYFIPGGVVIPQYVAPSQPFKVPSSGCSGLPMPYNPGSTGPNCLQAGATVPSGGVTLVGLRPYSSPNCQPYTGVGCPADGVPVFTDIFAEDTIANSNYNALQVSVERSYSHGLLFQASYTFSKAIDQGASFENELNPVNYNATRGLSLLDAKHRFVFSPVWDIPVPAYSGFTEKVLDGWGASAIITWQSGFPIRVEDENDSELQSSYNFEAANTPVAVAPVHFLNPKTNGGLWFDPSSFSDPTINSALPLGQFGNTPHALCCGPALSDTDLVITKKTSINERWNTEFRAEFYNAWNHTQFANPDGNFTDGLPPFGTFGLIQKTRVGPRVMQFGLKLLF